MDALIASLTIFVLAIFVGFEVSAADNTLMVFGDGKQAILDLIAALKEI